MKMLAAMLAALTLSACQSTSPYPMPPYSEAVVLEQAAPFVDAEHFLADAALQEVCRRTKEQVALGDTVIACALHTGRPGDTCADYSADASFVYYRDDAGADLRWLRWHELGHVYEVRVLGISPCESGRHVGWGGRPTGF